MVENIRVGFPGLPDPLPYYYSECRLRLEEGLAGNWTEYEKLAKPNYDDVDRVVAWAKREQERGHPMYVHMNPVFWEFDKSETIQPIWFRGDLLAKDAHYYNWTPEQRKSILGLMEEHVTGLVTRYCRPTLLFEETTPNTPTPSPTPLATPHPWRGTRLDGVVAVYEVLNEVTEENGSARQMDGTGTAFAWAIVNPLAASDVEYPTNHDPRNYYVYKAFQYAELVADAECKEEDGDVEPRLSLNNHFRVDLPIDGTDRNNHWAEGTRDLVVDVNEGRPGNNLLIDTIGIQSHIWRIFEPNPTPTLPSNVTPTATPTTPAKNGSPDGLRSIIEVFSDTTGVEVRITELDVSIMRGYYEGFFLPTPAAEYYDEQATLFRQVIHQCLYDESGGYDPICKEITFWVPFDTATDYKRCEYATLFSPANRIHPDCLTYSPTPTPSNTATSGPSPTPTNTPTPTHTYTPTPTFIAGNSPTPTDIPTRTPTVTLDPSVTPPTQTPSKTPLPIPTFFIVKQAHREVYKELETAPARATATPGGPTPTPTHTPIGAYPAPLQIPTPEATATPVSYP